MSPVPLSSRLLASLVLLGACGKGGGEAAVPQETLADTEPATVQEAAASGWETLPGREPRPTGPVVMLAGRERVFTLIGNRLGEYLPEENAWRDLDLVLPAALGEGGSATIDTEERLYVLRGGRTPDAWRIDTRALALEVLPATPDVVGRGACLAHDPERDTVYALRGDASGDCWRYDPGERSWSSVPPIEARIKMIGNPSGAIVYKRDTVLAWPDHHIKQYDVVNDKARNLWSYGFRPWKDALHVHDYEAELWFVLLGKGSRTISIFDPYGKHWGYVRPRLPAPIRGEGLRGVVTRVGGRKHLVLYDVAGENRVHRIPLDAFQWIRVESPAADIGSRWRSIHERWGSSTVRPDTGGLMGAVGDGLYFVRFKGARTLDPRTSEWSGYPGIPIVDRLPPGLASASDGERTVYAFAGGGRHFARADTETMEGEVLPEPDQDAEIGAQLRWHAGRVFALLGGETRAVRAYDPESRTWSTLPDLPEEATPVGGHGSGLVVSEGSLVAVTGRGAWRLGSDGGWSKVLELPYEVSHDGGMVAADTVGTKLFLVEGAGSRRMTVCDLADASYARDVLLPDAVSVRGNRAFVTTIDGTRVFGVMRGHDTNEIFLIDVEDLLELAEEG